MDTCRVSTHRRIRFASRFSALLCGSTAAIAGNFVEPTVFSSSNGLLDLLIIAKPEPVPGISFPARGGAPILHPTGWVYEVCPRQPASSVNQCPPGSGVADYGGVRLALQKGDTLKIRLVNKLPRLDPVKVNHQLDPGGTNLPLNPTNLDFQGLKEPPRAPTLANPSFGQDIWVRIYNLANGAPQPEESENMHEMNRQDAVLKNFADYQIDISANHPSGLLWFHPFLYGLTSNQIASGLSGIISVGRAGDYARDDRTKDPFPEDHVRHLILKNMQVLAAGDVRVRNGIAAVANGEVLNEADPAFCTPFPASPTEVRHGACPGADNTSSGGNSYVGGQWYFTVSGQQYPTLRVSAPDGEIWRLINTSDELSYDLQLINDAMGESLTTQLISVDGTAVRVPPSTPPGAKVQIGGASFKVADCRPARGGGFSFAPVCISQLAIAPRSRAEMWVAYRDEEGRVAAPPKGAAATLKMIGVASDGTSDSRPAVDLAKIEFAQTGRDGVIDFGLDVRAEALAAGPPANNFGAAFP